MTGLDVGRRAVLAASAGLAAMAATGPTNARAQAADDRVRRGSSSDPITVAMLVHPKMVMQDLVGPMTVLKLLGCHIDMVWKNKAPVMTDLGIAVTPTQSFDECARDLDVLMVPGGIHGTIECMNDPETLDFLADRGTRAAWVTSVCTGGLTVAAAGLFQGFDATTHWAVSDLLPLMGARHVDQRVVSDRNRMSCGGVTAGIDLALALAIRLKGEEAAKRVQLIMEYSPVPPIQSGTPAEAGPDLVDGVKNLRRETDSRARAAAEVAAKRLASIHDARRVGN